MTGSSGTGAGNAAAGDAAAGAPTTPTTRWATVVAFSAVAAVTQMVWLTFAAVTTVASEHYGVSVATMGWLAQLFVLFYVALAIPAGILLDRNLRTWLSAGAVLTAVGAAIRMVGDSYAWLLVGAIVAAIVQPLVLNAVTAVAAQYAAERDRPAAIAMSSGSIFVGMVLAFLLGIVFSGADQMPALVAAQAVLAVLAAAGLVWALRTVPPYPALPVPSGLAAFRTAWGTPLIRLLCVFTFLPYGVFIALTTWTEALLDPAGVTADQAGVILIVMVVAGVAGSATLPVWAAKRRRETGVLTVAVLVCASGCLVLALAPGFVTGLVALIAVGYFTLAALPILLELTERDSAEAEGTASGLIWLSGNLGGLVVATVIGFTTGSPALSFSLLAAVTLVSLPILGRLRSPVAALPPVSGL